VRNYQIVIVSAVKICKRCLQTALASGDFAFGHHWGSSVPRVPWATAAASVWL